MCVRFKKQNVAPKRATEGDLTGPLIGIDLAGRQRLAKVARSGIKHVLYFRKKLELASQSELKRRI